MFSMIRRKLHLTPSMAIAFVALVFAVTGASFAAGTHGGGSGAGGNRISAAAKSKAKPKAKAGPRGPAGPAGKTGATGAQGAAGATGAKGETGSKGDTGTNGETGPVGPEGKTGPQGGTGGQGPQGVPGKPWTPNNVLPSGATEKGAWSASGKPANFFGTELVFASISFTVPVPNGLVGGEGCAETGPRTKPCEVHVLKIGQHGEGKFEAGVAGHDGPNTGCPTTSAASKPEAEPGNLCIFTDLSINAEKVEPTDPGEGTSEAAGPTGSTLWVHASATPLPNTEGVLISGTWAATAP